MKVGKKSVRNPHHIQKIATNIQEILFFKAEKLIKKEIDKKQTRFMFIGYKEGKQKIVLKK